MTTTRTTGRTCSVELTRRELPEAQAAALVDLLADPGRSSRWLQRALSDAGITLSYDSVRRHRRGGCRCCDGGRVTGLRVTDLLEAARD